MDACPDTRLPVLDMIDVSDSTRSGCCAARVWAIIPPIEAPTTPAQQLPRRGRAHGLEVRRSPGVAIVVADDEEAPVDQRAAEVLVPADHLRPQPHDQEHCGVAGV